MKKLIFCTKLSAGLAFAILIEKFDSLGMEVELDSWAAGVKKAIEIFGPEVKEMKLGSLPAKLEEVKRMGVELDSRAADLKDVVKMLGPEVTLGSLLAKLEKAKKVEGNMEQNEVVFKVLPKVDLSVGIKFAFTERVAADISFGYSYISKITSSKLAPFAEILGGKKPDFDFSGFKVGVGFHYKF